MWIFIRHDQWTKPSDAISNCYVQLDCNNICHICYVQDWIDYVGAYNSNGRIVTFIFAVIVRVSPSLCLNWKNELFTQMVLQFILELHFGLSNKLFD